MKMPKAMKRYCPKCKKATEQKVEFYKVSGKRSTFSRGSLARARRRGQGTGVWNLGKWGSKPAISKWKRTGAKGSKKSTLKYTCKLCNKATQQKKGFRAKKLEFK